MSTEFGHRALYAFPEERDHDLMSLYQASVWASKYLNKEITSSNISYLVQYGRINKYLEKGTIAVSKSDLVNYYKDYRNSREDIWKSKLGGDLNWHLSFDSFREKATTKHVHRLHPYKESSYLS